MYRFLATIGIAATAVVPAAAGAEFDPEKLAKTVAPYLDDRTVLVAHIDATRLDAKRVMETLAHLSDNEVRDFEAIQKRLEEMLQCFLTAGGTDCYIILSLLDMDWDLIALKPAPFIVAPAKNDGNSLTEFLRKTEGSAELLGDAVVAGSKSTLERLRKLKPVARPELVKALGAAGDGAIQVCLMPPEVLRRAIEEMLPELPEDLGGGSIKELTRGCQWAAANVKLTPEFQFQLTMQAEDASSAQTFQAALVRLIKGLAGHKQFREFVPNAGKAIALSTPEASGSRLTLMRNEKELTALLQPILAPFAPPPRSDTTIKLGKILLALHNYHDAYGHLPAAATYDKQGKPLLSWRVQILPFLGENKLYNEFHLDEPWDSDHNKKLIARMPAVFRSSENAELAKEGKTTFLAPLGDDAMFPNKRGIRLADVLDGTANTILLVDVEDSRAVVWTRPEDWRYDPADPFRGLARRLRGRHIVGLANASVKVLKKEISKATMQKLFTRADGNPVGADF